MARRLTVILVVVAITLMPAPAHAQTAAPAAWSSCTAATRLWDTQDEWAVAWLTLAFAQHAVSAGDVNRYYVSWANAFGVDAPCDGATLTSAASAQVTSARSSAFADCLRNGVENRRWAVQKFTEHSTAIANSGSDWSEVQTALEASWEYVQGLARSAGLRACRY